MNLSVALDLPVALVDFDAPFSSLASMLRIYPTRTWDDWRGSVRDMANQVRDTVYLISNPVDRMVRPDRGTVMQVLEQSRKEFRFCIVDCGSRLDEYTREVCRIADRVIVVSTVDQVAIRNNLIYVAGLETGGTVEWILNRVDGKLPFRLEELERESGHRVAVVLPEFRAMQRYVLKGELVVEKRRLSAWTRKLKRYADELAGRK